MKNKPANNFADVFFICIVCESRPRDHEILQNISQKAKTEQKVRGLRYKDQSRKGAVRKRAHGNTVCRHCKIVCVTWIWTDCVVLVPPHAPHRPHGVWLQDGARSAAPIPVAEHAPLLPKGRHRVHVLRGVLLGAARDRREFVHRRPSTSCPSFYPCFRF